MIKKIFIPVILLLLISQTSFAQTEQGRFAISGATNVKLFFQNLKPETTEETNGTIKSENYQFDLGAGIFVIDNLAIGLSGAYQYDYQKKQIYTGSTPGDESYTYEAGDEETWSISPVIRYYLPLEGNLRPTLMAGFGYLTSKKRNNQTSTDDMRVSHFDGTTLNLGAGVSYFINQSISINLGFEYYQNNLKNKIDTRFTEKQNLYGLSAGLSVYF